MKMIHRILCAGIAAAVAMSMMPTTVFAEETPVSSPAELIIDMVEMAAVDIESSTLQTAYDTVEGLVTVNSDQVYYDGISIGYWYADAPTNIYKDAERTATALTITDGAYIVDPVLLSNIMNDFNNQLVESYVPTTADWSKIIGKYDVTLGDQVIKADEWYELDVFGDPAVEGDLFNLSEAIGIKASQPNGRYITMGWLIDENGGLYLHRYSTVSYIDGMTGKYSHVDNFGTAVAAHNNYCNEGYSQAYTFNSHTDYYQYYGLSNIDGKIVPTSYFGTLTKSELYKVPTGENLSGYDTWYNVSIPDKTFDWSSQTVKKCGIISFWTKGANNAEGSNMSGLGVGNLYFYGTNSNGVSTAVRKLIQDMWTSQSSSKVVNGNTQLTQRLSKLAQLELTDTISLTADGWSVNGAEDLDFYVGATSMNEAGSTTDIAALADVEAMVFNVVVPSTLPIYVDEYGKVSVADNAIVQNLSCASVVITEVKINESQSGDWTLVDANPSPNRDANEFTFTTTLREGIVLAKDEVLSFTYGAELSPVTSGAVALDLATVSVTVDWAPVDNP